MKVTVNGVPVPFHLEMHPMGVEMLVLDTKPLRGGDDVRVLGEEGGDQWVRFPYQGNVNVLTGNLRLPVEEEPA